MSRLCRLAVGPIRGRGPGRMRALERELRSTRPRRSKTRPRRSPQRVDRPPLPRPRAAVPEAGRRARGRHATSGPGPLPDVTSCARALGTGAAPPAGSAVLRTSGRREVAFLLLVGAVGFRSRALRLGRTVPQLGPRPRGTTTSTRSSCSFSLFAFALSVLAGRRYRAGVVEARELAATQQALRPSQAEAEHANQAKSLFLANVSHELLHTAHQPDRHERAASGHRADPGARPVRPNHGPGGSTPVGPGDRHSRLLEAGSRGPSGCVVCR